MFVLNRKGDHPPASTNFHVQRVITEFAAGSCAYVGGSPLQADERRKTNKSAETVGDDAAAADRFR